MPSQLQRTLSRMQCLRLHAHWIILITAKLAVVKFLWYVNTLNRKAGKTFPPFLFFSKSDICNIICPLFIKSYIRLSIFFTMKFFLGTFITLCLLLSSFLLCFGQYPSQNITLLSHWDT